MYFIDEMFPCFSCHFVMKEHHSEWICEILYLLLAVVCLYDGIVFLLLVPEVPAALLLSWNILHRNWRKYHKLLDSSCRRLKTEMYLQSCYSLFFVRLLCSCLASFSLPHEYSPGNEITSLNYERVSRVKLSLVSIFIHIFLIFCKVVSEFAFFPKISLQQIS